MLKRSCQRPSIESPFWTYLPQFPTKKLIFYYIFFPHAHTGHVYTHINTHTHFREAHRQNVSYWFFCVRRRQPVRNHTKLSVFSQSQSCVVKSSSYSVCRLVCVSVCKCKISLYQLKKYWKKLFDFIVCACVSHFPCFCVCCNRSCGGNVYHPLYVIVINTAVVRTNE